MVFVLVLLCILLSGLTIKEQFPTGADAGRQVAREILTRHGPSASVVVVTRDTGEDRAFSDAAEETLRDGGAAVVGVVNGSAADVRRLLESMPADQRTVDAIAANEVTARWSVYDRFPDVGSSKCVTPRSYRWPDFLKISNLKGVASQTAIYAVIAIGMTLVIITAGIDLSVGSLVALSSVTAALFVSRQGGENAGTVIVIGGWLLALTTCAAHGAFTGLMITRFRIPAFIVTLALMKTASGLAYRLSGGSSIPDLPDAFFAPGRGEVAGIPNPVVLMAGLYAAAHIVMSHTIFGRYVYAIGGNQEAARLSGVPVRRVLLAVYTISGALAGLGGLVLTSQLGAGDPKFGLMYELDVIAAVVVGGTSLMGGRGKVMGTLIGAFIISTIRNGMNLTNVHPFNQDIVLGAVLLGAVLLDTLKRRAST